MLSTLIICVKQLFRFKIPYEPNSKVQFLSQILEENYNFLENGLTCPHGMFSNNEKKRRHRNSTWLSLTIAYRSMLQGNALESA